MSLLIRAFHTPLERAEIDPVAIERDKVRHIAVAALGANCVSARAKDVGSGLAVGTAAAIAFATILCADEVRAIDNVPIAIHANELPNFCE